MSLLRSSTNDDAVILEGEIDLAVADEGLRTLLDAAAAGTTTVDLSGVTFMDSSGLNMLLTVANTLNGSGPLVIRRPSPAVRRVLDLTLPNGAPGLVVADDDR